MRCFQNILIVAPQAERTDTALEHALAVAQACGATAITVVDVLHSGTPRLETTIEMDIARQEEQLVGLVEPLKRRGVNVDCRVFVGEPVPEIIRQVERNGYDLVVVPAAAQRPARGKLVGVPIVPLMRGCPCPVWVLKPTPALHGGILVAVNPTSAEDQDGALSQSLIHLAACLARALGSQLSILHVWQLPGESQIRRPLVGAKSEQIAALLDRSHKRAALQMRQLLDKIDLRGTKYEFYFEKGHQPAQVIADFAVRRQIGTVIMGMTGRRRIAGLLVGNSAEEVLRGVPCSVVTLGSARSFSAVAPDEASLASK